MSAPAITEAGEPDDFLGAREGEAAGDATHLQVCRFLHREARLLDEERYEDWLGLFAQDARYWMPTVENRYRRDPAGPVGRTRMAFYDDTFETLRLRVRRLRSGLAWAEDPPTRHVHAISNIEAFETDDPQLLIAHSVFTSYRNKLYRDESTLMGRRADVLQRTADGLRIRRRKILLAQALLLSRNLNVFL
jgi:ethylbenzene dioxygenase subunit beta